MSSVDASSSSGAAGPSSAPVVDAASSSSSSSTSLASAPSSSSSVSSATVARPGDTVIIYEGPSRLSPLTLVPGETFQNRFGIFSHDDILGKGLGRRIRARARGGSTLYRHQRPVATSGAGAGAGADVVLAFEGGYVTVLALTPELWTLSLPHRTQILYFADIAHVILHLRLRPGGVVVESGTGSGSLTHALARAVAPTGRVHSFEFNAHRVEQARAEFAAHGLSGVVSVTHRDAVGRGFQPEAGVGLSDGVFLDLPNPWGALPHARACLKACGVLCSFSPCMEQVTRTVAELERLGFESIRTVETLLRPYDVESEGLEAARISLVPGGAAGAAEAIGAGGTGAAAASTAAGEKGVVSSTVWRAPKAKVTKTQQPPRGKAGAAGASAAAEATPVAAAAGAPAPPSGVGSKRARAEEEGAGGKGEGEEEAVPVAPAAAATAPAAKVVVVAAPALAPAPAPVAAAASSSASSSSSSSSRAPATAAAVPAPWPADVLDPLPTVTRAAAQTRGHTSYLTFATLYRR
jgi:tRNA (adenine57-N1/adenine58-N1)-methyltransferase catalytic subunit